MGQGLHHDVHLFYQIHRDRLTEASISYDDVIHAMGLVSVIAADGASWSCAQVTQALLRLCCTAVG